MSGVPAKIQVEKGWPTPPKSGARMFRGGANRLSSALAAFGLSWCSCGFPMFSLGVEMVRTSLATQAGSVALNKNEQYRDLGFLPS